MRFAPGAVHLVDDDGLRVVTRAKSAGAAVARRAAGQVIDLGTAADVERPGYHLRRLPGAPDAAVWALAGAASAKTTLTAPDSTAACGSKRRKRVGWLTISSQDQHFG